MVVFPKSKLQEAAEILLRLGFNKQHERIFHYIYTAGDLRYQCVLGLEEASDSDYEVSLSIMQRPVGNKKQGIRLEDVRVLSIEDAPSTVQDVVRHVEEQLHQLG